MGTAALQRALLGITRLADSLVCVNDAGPTETPQPDQAPDPLSKGEQTRALILETAMRLFQERGYDKTTMRAIAAEAGVSVGNAYYYYEGKDLRSISSIDFASSRAGTVGECGRRDI
jgi:hypothetical protein